MNKNITAIFAIGILIFIAAACSGSFTTANISKLAFSTSKTGEPAATTFNTGEDIYAVATVSNTSEKLKLNFKVTYENVQGKGKGEEVGNKTMDFEGASQLWQQFSTPLPGEYKVEVTLSDNTGKKIDSKSGTLTVKGSGPTTAPASSNSNSKKDEETIISL